MEYALFKTPIVGDIELFAHILHGQFSDRRRKYVEGNTLIYKEIFQKQITGDDSVIDEIKHKARQAIENLQNSLDEFKIGADHFNKNVLVNFISENIQIERNRRNLKTSSENKIKIFE